MMGLRILHLEDSERDSELVQSRLEMDGLPCAIDRVWSRTGFETAIRVDRYDLILSDFSLPGFDGFSALKIAQAERPDLPFIFVSGTIGEERAVESLKNGAVDYVLKDRLSRLVSAIRRARADVQARRELQRNHELVRRQAQLLDEARDAIFVRNLDQIVTYWNKGAERIYGWSAKEVIGRKASELLYKPDAPRRDEVWNAVLRDGEWTGELTQVSREGKELRVASRRTLLRDPSGAPVGVLNINTDITEKKALEAQALRSQRMDSIGALAGGIAHDLNNVLAPILMAAELLRDQQPNADCVRMLDVAKNSAHRGAELVKQILQFARGSQRGEETISLKANVQEIAKFISKTFPPMIEIDAAIEGRTEIVGDATQVHQALLNLCVNARDAMPNGGRLTIGAREVRLNARPFQSQPQPVSGEFVELSVRDSGEGIPANLLGRIFEPFFTTKAEGKGTGLGLSTVMTIIRNHRGFLEVQSEVGKGTTFQLYFPAAPNRRAVAAETANAIPTGRGETVLLIDDEAALLEMTRQLLEAHNYKTLTAHDGAEGLRQFEAHQNDIHAVVTDLLMPDLGGRELIGLLRAKSPKLFIVCMSGSVDPSVGQSSILGADIFLRKPSPTQDLLKALSRMRHERVVS